MPRCYFVLFVVIGVLGAFPETAFDQESSPLTEIQWQEGPLSGHLGSVALLSVPSGYRFSDGAGARKFLEATHNPPSGNEVGILIPEIRNGEEPWFAIFEYDATGYINDDEKDSLDSDAILNSIKKGTEEANKERQTKGWGTFTVTGWEKAPYYDLQTHNLRWAIRGQDEKAEESVNYSTRILGRNGTMNVDLIVSPDQAATVLPKFDNVLSGFAYNSGSRYADFVSGDKVAGYGLTALIAGGAGAVAMKSGLLAKLWKFIVAVVLGLVAFVKRMFRKLFGKRSDAANVPSVQG